MNLKIDKLIWIINRMEKNDNTNNNDKRKN